MISLWPLRAGVLVDRGVAYLAAGIFPAEGVFFYALDAKDGRVLWRNDAAGEAPQSQVSPQGYLLASATTLYAPMGRVSPAALDRRDGKLKYLAYFGKNVGGTYALVTDGEVYTGTEELLAYRGESKERLASYPGQKIVVQQDVVYLAGMTRLSALDRKAYPAASNKVQSLRSQLTALETAAKKTPPPSADAAKAGQLAQQIKRAEQELSGTVRWQVPCRLHEALILAGDVLVVGGAGQVQAIDSGSGKTLWTGKVEGTAKGLAVAAGRLFVSTDSGRIYSFGGKGSQEYGSVAQPIDPDPYRDSPLAPRLRQAAESILAQTDVRRGYCLILGCETGQLALELARRTDLMIYAVSPDAAKVAAARRPLDAAGVYGTRVCVDQFPLDQIPVLRLFRQPHCLGDGPGHRQVALPPGAGPADAQATRRHGPPRRRARGATFRGEGHHIQDRSRSHPWGGHLDPSVRQPGQHRLRGRPGPALPVGGPVVRRPGAGDHGEPPLARSGALGGRRAGVRAG